MRGIEVWLRFGENQMSKLIAFFLIGFNATLNHVAKAETQEHRIVLAQSSGGDAQVLSVQ